MPLARQKADMSSAARRSIREKRNLVGDDADALPSQHAQVVGVEIGDAQVTDETFRLQSGELAERVEPGRMLEHPPVQLHEIDRSLP